MPSRRWVDLNAKRRHRMPHENSLLCFILSISIVTGEPEELRLAGGSTECEGRVEVKHQGEWGTVCNDYWNVINNAAVVCRQLGCSDSLAIPTSSFGRGSGRIWMDDVRCTGTESALRDCPRHPWGLHNCDHSEDVGVLCPGEIHSVIILPCYVVQFTIHWVYIRDVRFGLGFCADLMFCDAENVSTLFTYGNFLCGFMVPKITIDSLAEHREVRLLGGPNSCSGYLEIKTSTWGSICELDQNLITANVICRELHCGIAVPPPWNIPYTERQGKIIDEDILCSGNETSIFQCPTEPRTGINCTNPYYPYVHCQGINTLELLLTCVNVLFLFLTCSFDGFRLVSVNDTCSGRVELLYAGRWGTLCNSDWDLPAANVLCRQLHCGIAQSLPKGGQFGKGDGTLWNDKFHCSGTESHLSECSSTALGYGECPAWDTAGVVCTGKATSMFAQKRRQDSAVCRFTIKGKQSGCSPTHILLSPTLESLRLVDGGSHCAGKLEFLHSDMWSRVVDDRWDVSKAHTVCAQLHCGDATDVFRDKVVNPSSDHVTWNRIIISTHKMANDCGKHMQELYVSEGHFILRVPCVYPLCDWQNILKPCMRCMVNTFHRTHHTRDHPSELASLTDPSKRVENLKDVFLIAYFIIYCYSYKDIIYLSSIYFACSPAESRQLRLAAGPGQCAGRVEVYQQGEWGTVCVDHWDQKEAEVVCRQLGCGHAVSATTLVRHGRESGKIWLNDLKCKGSESTLWECNSSARGQHDCGRKEAGVIFSKTGTFYMLQIRFPRNKTDRKVYVTPGKYNSLILFAEFTDLRLAGGTHACEGRLEIYYNGTWGSVCENRLDSDSVSVICNQLGCGRNGKVMGRFAYGRGIEPYWLDGIECRKSAQSLWQCPSYSWSQKSCMYTEIAQIKCKINFLTFLIEIVRPRVGRRCVGLDFGDRKDVVLRYLGIER
uniref:SRCR domain-containing protein n=1 Tax=Leptobrachium leishanense TaxID=445787 RepID=A0A8C5R8H5_9ANUR